MDPKVLKLHQIARTCRENAYSPYSGYKVGAAIRTKDGKYFGGCNVENSSYGGTVCAERVAIQSAIAACGKIEIAEILVITDANPPWPPCGLCRQVIAEFAEPEVVVHASTLEGDLVSQTLGQIFPNAFTPKHLT